MKRYFGGLLIILSLVTAGTVGAEVVHINVPALARDYPPGDEGWSFYCSERVETLHYPGQEAGVVVELVAHLEGTVWAGLGECYGEPTALRAKIEPRFINLSTSDSFSRYAIVEEGPFAIDLVLHSVLPDPFYPDDDLLLWLCVLPEGCLVVEPVRADITDVTFIVTTEPVVPVESSTWGRIKALYER